MDEIKDILKKVVGKISSKEINDHEKIIKLLEKILKNKRIVRKIEVVGIKDESLLVNVDSSM